MDETVKMKTNKEHDQAPRNEATERSLYKEHGQTPRMRHLMALVWSFSSYRSNTLQYQFANEVHLSFLSSMPHERKKEMSPANLHIRGDIPWDTLLIMLVSLCTRGHSWQLLLARFYPKFPVQENYFIHFIPDYACRHSVSYSQR